MRTRVLLPTAFLVTAMSVAAVSWEPAPPGAAVGSSEAARVLGGATGSGSCTYLQLDLSTARTYCIGSSYQSCGGGDCGTLTIYGLMGSGGNLCFAQTSCSSKMCTGTPVYCGQNAAYTYGCGTGGG